MSILRNKRYFDGFVSPLSIIEFAEQQKHQYCHRSSPDLILGYAKGIARHDDPDARKLMLYMLEEIELHERQRKALFEVFDRLKGSARQTIPQAAVALNLE